MSVASIGDKVSATGDPIDPCLAVSPAGEIEPPPCEPPPPPPPPPPCEEPNVIDDKGDCVPPPPPPPPPPPGDEGCTPGYWKNHTDSWPPTGYSTSQSLVSVFGANALAGSLLEGLDFGGGSGVTGGKRILLRAAVSALLNSASPGVDYTRTTAQVIASVTTALGGTREDMLTLASALDVDNNLGCPLN